MILYARFCLAILQQLQKKYGGGVRKLRLDLIRKACFAISGQYPASPTWHAVRCVTSRQCPSSPSRPEDAVIRSGRCGPPSPPALTPSAPAPRPRAAFGAQPPPPQAPMVDLHGHDHGECVLGGLASGLGAGPAGRRGEGGRAGVSGHGESFQKGLRVGFACGWRWSESFGSGQGATRAPRDPATVGTTVRSPMAGRKPPHEARGPTALSVVVHLRHRLLVAEGDGWSRRPTSSSPTPARFGPGPSGSPGSWKPTATRGRGSGPGLIAGHNWVHEVQQATAMAERVVAVLSTTYLQSGHGEAEWRAFYAGRRAGSRPRRRSSRRPAVGGQRHRGAPVPGRA
jgi:hypothetical protein